MTHMEFGEFGNYLVQLWPMLEFTQAQRDAWWDKFQVFTLDDAKRGAKDAYLTGKYTRPKPHEVIDSTRRYNRERVAEGDKDFSPEFVAQVQREEADESDAIKEWTDDEREGGRQEIVRHESGMARLLGKRSLHSPMLTHFLVERYVHQRVTIFPNGHPQQIHRDQYWGVTP